MRRNNRSRESRDTTNAKVKKELAMPRISKSARRAVEKMSNAKISKPVGSSIVPSLS